MKLVSLQTFELAVSRYFEPIAQQLKLPLIRRNDELYEIPSASVTMEIRLIKGHAGYLVVAEIYSTENPSTYITGSGERRVHVICVNTLAHPEYIDLPPTYKIETFLEQARCMKELVEKFYLPFMLGEKDLKPIEEAAKKRREEAAKNPYRKPFKNIVEYWKLQRFVDAQNPVFDDVCSELRAGRKTGHWMWFIFPQIQGLGRSETARQFAITSLAEAKAYLTHPILGPRLRECASLVASISGSSAEEIFGEIDSLKLCSSMTLFAQATPDNKIFLDVLEKYFGGTFDQRTLQLLESK